MYYITKENEIIYATGNNFNTREEAQDVLKRTYEDVQGQDDIVDIKLTEDTLTFTDRVVGDSDEIHTFTIRKEAK
jgi:hypothetical protein